MPNSEAEKDEGAGAREFEAWAAIDATFSFRDAFMAGRSAGWAARGKADAAVVAAVADDVEWHQADTCRRIKLRLRSLDAAPSPAPTDTKDGGE